MSTAPARDPQPTTPAWDRRRPPTPWSSHLAVVRSHPWLILAAAVVAIAASALYVDHAPRRYQAHAQLLVSVDPVDQPALAELGLLHVSSEAGRPAQTVAWLAMSRRVAAYAAAELGGDPSAGAIASEIVAQPVAGADVVDIAATTRHPATAAAIANAVADGVRSARAADLEPTIDRLIAQRRAALADEIPTRGAASATLLQLQDLESLRANGDPSIHVLQKASVPTSASWPNPPVVMAGAALVGLLVGVLGAFAVESRAPRLRSQGQLRRLFAAPVVATIPPAESRRWSGRGRRPRPVTPNHLPAAASEQIRTLSHRLVGRHCVLVTGASGGEGRTTLALAFANAAALAGRDTILLEVDSRTGALGGMLGLTAYSMDDVLSDPNGLKLALATPHGLSPLLRVLPASGTSRSLADLPQPGQVVELVRRASELADLVVIDAAPLGIFGDAVPLVATADLALMVVRVGTTQLDALAHAAAELDGVDSGTVVVGRRPANRRDRRLLPPLRRSDG
ncbi:MAG: hypothetical protein ACRDQC_00130 [Gaiellales bacterium]